jgi:hypothetical protein
MKNFGLFFIIWAFSFSAFGQSKIPAPKDVLGFVPGDDRKLASWAQTVEYFKRLAAASDRVKFEEIGESTKGNLFVYAAISAPENLAQLEKYKEINQKLADPRLIKSNDAAAQNLIKQGKTIVLITCGIHSNEVGSYLSSMLIAEGLARAEDAETQKILQETIILLVPSLNPDGVDIIKNWYDKTLGTSFEGSEPPELYAKYVGHDNNRDWYAFTQTETQLTVDKLHNVWHPQIVHDIHQQGAFGARLFLPPYHIPVEPNVPTQIVEGYTELGNYIAGAMRREGFEAITTDSTYDAWTPARAYSHYHGGVRILSETASCKLATPVTIKFDQLRAGLAYNAKQESANFSPVWRGGEWHLRDITNYMTRAAFLLLKHAADNRQKWLSRFYQIGKQAVSERKNGELFAFLIPPQKNDFFVNDVLYRAGVESDYADTFTLENVKYEAGTRVIRLAQPYGAFAKAILERQKYPDLRDEKNHPIAPYDVTAHTLSLLTGVEVVPIYKPFKYPLKKRGGYGNGSGNGCGETTLPTRWIYRSFVPAIDEGWTRWVYENYSQMIPNRNSCEPIFKSASDEEIRNGDFKGAKSIVFPDQPPNQILNGFAKGTMPDEYTGGIGRKGAENLKKFAEAGGTLVFLNRAARFAIREFNLPVRDAVENLERKDFYIPGSILRMELDTKNVIAKNMPENSIAWFEDSPAFEVAADARVEIVARYPAKPAEILLSGWALGAERIAGKAALVVVPIGKGKIVLFGFRPQYRGQSLATFPLLFNAIAAR